jgi:hypothetical protein
MPLSVKVCTPVSETGELEHYQQRQPIQFTIFDYF